MPASITAKSAATELGMRSATKSSKSPEKSLTPGHDGQVALARATEVWKKRTFRRSGLSRSTLSQ
jgi:hypothetical protein